MEKGFNDDELADIMNEIETLEQEFEQDGESEAESQPEEVQAQQEDNDEAHSDGAFKPEEMNAVLEDLAEMSEEESVPQEESQMSKPEQEKAPNIHQFPSGSSGGSAQTSMNFKVSGDLNLDLGFQFGSEQVHIFVSEDEGFVIEMSSGAKFTIPVSQENKKAA